MLLLVYKLGTSVFQFVQRKTFPPPTNHLSQMTTPANNFVEVCANSTIQLLGSKAAQQTSQGIRHQPCQHHYQHKHQGAHCHPRVGELHRSCDLVAHTQWSPHSQSTHALHHPTCPGRRDVWRQQPQSAGSHGRPVHAGCSASCNLSDPPGKQRGNHLPPPC